MCGVCGGVVTAPGPSVLSSRVVEMSDLSIEKGRSAWKLLVDVFCIDHDGNVLDAALAAIMAALKTLQLPAVSVNEADHVVSVQPGTSWCVWLTQLRRVGGFCLD